MRSDRREIENGQPARERVRPEVSGPESLLGCCLTNVTPLLCERRWFVLERPRRDTNGGSIVPCSLDDDDDDVYYFIRWRRKLEGETENMGVCTKERKGVTAEVLRATPLPALIHWEVKVGGRGMKDAGGAVLAGSSPPFLGRERAAVDVHVGPERRSPRYHDTSLALESVKESSAAVSKPRCVVARAHVQRSRVVSRCAWRNTRRTSSQ